MGLPSNLEVLIARFIHAGAARARRLIESDRLEWDMGESPAPAHSGFARDRERGGMRPSPSSRLTLARAHLDAAMRRLRGQSRVAPAPLPAESFAALHESVGDVVLLHDRTGAVLSIAGNRQSLFGLPAADLMGRGFFEHVHVADRPIFLKAIGEASFSDAPITVALRLRASSLDRGDYAEPVFLWLDMRARRCGKHSPERSAVAIFRNVTDAHWRQDELDSAGTAADLSKDHFLANVSHELRTPLNAIIGFSEILGDADQAPRDPAKQREYAAIIHRSGQHLLSVVNSILDLSKIHSGSFDLSPSHFGVAPLVEVCCDMVKLEAQDRHIELKRVCPEGLPEIVGDKRACKQIVINLLSNAVKFTPAHGEVSISVSIEDETLLIAVADSGVGINEQDLARLGNPFFQARGALDRPFEGTGLGLSIVSGLVGLHGGSIAVASEPDQGTCVLVRLPVDCRAAVDKARPSAEIETIARYRRGDEEHDLVQKVMVKKIA
ncbi:PAS/PAC sensor signal transduction histidine kinase [Methylocella silvestris BL2]|uniref:histidine kinase n=1 Tax=Methylocella silvestris (strain DSM 15510 / CIP 108128 / LMG 27833 / NCIMB 13906 / BL2) TaxID=395965 RepID=B8EK78_METSB|nr:PAS domain-containing sensor histidine kinase [Methylocella silvestris]ACK50618.1 PAS/PAC sensor signal transduction histidine kinase [Methylocella silvestris BL2]